MERLSALIEELRQLPPTSETPPRLSPPRDMLQNKGNSPPRVQDLGRNILGLTEDELQLMRKYSVALPTSHSYPTSGPIQAAAPHLGSSQYGRGRIPLAERDDVNKTALPVERKLAQAGQALEHGSSQRRSPGSPDTLSSDISWRRRLLQEDMLGAQSAQIVLSKEEMEKARRISVAKDKALAAMRGEISGLRERAGRQAEEMRDLRAAASGKGVEEALGLMRQKLRERDSELHMLREQLVVEAGKTKGSRVEDRRARDGRVLSSMKEQCETLERLRDADADDFQPPPPHHRAPAVAQRFSAHRDAIQRDEGHEAGLPAGGNMGYTVEEEREVVASLRAELRHAKKSLDEAKAYIRQKESEVEALAAERERHATRQQHLVAQAAAEAAAVSKLRAEYADKCDALEVAAANNRVLREDVNKYRGMLDAAGRDAEKVVEEMSRKAQLTRVELSSLAQLIRKRLAGAPLSIDMFLTHEAVDMCGPRYADGLSDLEHMLDEVKNLRGLLADCAAEQMGQECAVQ